MTNLNFFAQPCKGAPTALSFHLCKNLRVEDLKIVNSQQIHVSVEDCTNVQLARLSITAPHSSPNTDGIHITRSKDVKVTNCKIRTGKYHQHVHSSKSYQIVMFTSLSWNLQETIACQLRTGLTIFMSRKLCADRATGSASEALEITTHGLKSLALP